ncbi:ATP-binding protein [Bacillus cereus group sp. Bce018]|uniref:sensor histidine kinase n=1 Tax=Bacillus cereus group sp. Bce018 TaxID=3445248 RepID=UPI003F202083
MIRVRKCKYQLVVTLISLILFSYFVTIIMNYPRVGIEVADRSNDLVINKIEKNSWAEKQNLQIGDIVEKIDDVSPDENNAISSYCVAERAKNIAVRKGEEIREYKIKYTPYDKQLIYHLFLPAIFYLTCFFMATYILIRVPEMNDGTKDLIYFLHCLGIIFISIMAGLRKDVLAYVVASVSIIYSFVFFIKFMNISFQDLKTKFITRLKLIHIYVIAVILVCLTIFIYIKHNALATKYIILLISFLFLLTIYLLFKFYIKSKQSYYFKFIRMIMMSLIISAIPFVVLFVIPSLMNKQGIIGVEMIAIFFLFVPICLFYMIIAGKLFDLNFIIRRAQYYILLSMCLTGFLVILGILIFHNKGDNILDVIRFGFIVFISMSLFLFLKDYLDFRLRGRLYHYQKNYQFSLHRFLHQAKSEYKLSNLIFSIKREIADVLKMEETCCIEINKEDKSFQIIDGESIHEDVLNQLNGYQLETYTVGSIIKLESHFVFVLSISTETIIILFCKYSGRENLNVHEISWLETLCSYADLLLECSHQVEDLVSQLQTVNELIQPPVWLSKLLFNLSEKERTNLASDIHDGVLQDQIRLSRKLEAYHNEISDEKMKNIINEVYEDVLDHIYVIRETCNNLRPPFLYELGLKKALLDLYKQVNLKATFFFYYEIQDNIILPNVEYEQAIYRIIQELLNNAQKHSKASTVTIRLYEIGDHLYVTYIDDGIGIDLDEVKYSYGSLGLSGIVTRIQSLDGEISIDSKSDNGLKMKIRMKIR